MLKIIEIKMGGVMHELDKLIEVKTTEEAKKLMKNGDLPVGQYQVIAVHGEFKVTETRQMEIEQLDVKKDNGD